MLNSEEIDVYCHFMYPSALDIIKRLKKVWNGSVTVSLVKDAEHNAVIRKALEESFEDLTIKEYKNRGTDQYGFWRNFGEKQDKKGWCFSIHDKTDMKWIRDILYKILDNYKAVNEVIHEDNDVGIIVGDDKYYMAIRTEEELIEETKVISTSLVRQNLLAKHMLCWLRQLQWMAYQNSGGIPIKEINFNFCAGNIFIARNDVVEISHECLQDNFFEEFYRKDGDIGHALERFYFYINNVILNMKTLTITNMVKND